MDPQTERLVRYLAHLTALGILDCRNPNSCGSPVYRDAQRAISVALDDGPQRPTLLRVLLRKK